MREKRTRPRDARGAIAGWIGVLRDVTERQRAHVALEVSEKRLRTALDAMLDGVSIDAAIRDQQGRITDFRIDYANSAVGAIGGTAGSLQMGRTLLELFPAHRTNGLFDAYVKVVETGLPFESGAFRYADPDAAGGPLEGVLDLRAAKLGDGLVIAARDVTDREQLTRERERLASAIEQSTDGIVITDPDVRIVYANAAYARSVGRAPAELVGRSAREVVAIGLDAPTVAAMERGVGTGQHWATEAEHRFPDGTLHRFEIVLEPIRGIGSAITSWVSVIRDVTGRHHAESEMRRLSTVIEQASDAIVITDTSGTIEYVNPAFEQVTGYTSAEVLGQNPRILKSGVQGPAFYAAMWASLTSGQPFVGDLTNRHKDGSMFQEEAVISPIRDEAGTITSYVAVKRNVTERKRLEDERARLTAAVEQAADFVIVNDRDGIVQAVNPAFERLTGYPAAEAIGKSVAGLLRSGVDLPETSAALDAAILHGKAWVGRVAERRADGGLLDADLSISPIRNAAGELIGTVEIGRDRTHEREMEAEREREAQIRVALAESLATIPEHATLEQAAQAICDELVRLPFVDVAEIEIFVNDEWVEMLAVAAPPGYSAIAGTRLPAAGAARVRDRTARGPWSGLVTDDPAAGFIPGVHAAGLRALAYGPIVHGGQVRGALVLERSTSVSPTPSCTRCRAWSPSAPPRARCSASGCVPVTWSATCATGSRTFSPPGPSARCSSPSSTSRRGRRWATRRSPASTPGSARTSASPTPGRSVWGPISSSPRLRRR